MVLIFTAPHGRHASTIVSEAATQCVAIDVVDLGQGQRVTRADGAEEHHPVAGPDSGPTAGDLNNPPDPSLSLASAGTPKIQRGRVRTRKAAKTTAVLTPDSPPVIWIQVGPGKFVRVEGGISAAGTTKAQEVVVDASLAKATPVYSPPMSTAPAESLAEHDPPDTPKTTRGDVGMVFVFEDHASELAIEEYGIAPSAFDPIPLVSRSVEHSVDDLPRVVADPGCITNRGGETSWCGVVPGRLWLQRPTFKGQAGWFSREIVTATPRASQVPSWQNVAAGRTLSVLGLSSLTPSVRLKQAMRLAFSRIAHFQRTRLPRSPPYGYSFCGSLALPAETYREIACGGYSAGGTSPMRHYPPSCNDSFSISYLISESRRRLRTMRCPSQRISIASP